MGAFASLAGGFFSKGVELQDENRNLQNQREKEALDNFAITMREWRKQNIASQQRVAEAKGLIGSFGGNPDDPVAQKIAQDAVYTRMATGIAPDINTLQMTYQKQRGQGQSSGAAATGQTSGQPQPGQAPGMGGQTGQTGAQPTSSSASPTGQTSGQPSPSQNGANPTQTGATPNPSGAPTDASQPVQASPGQPGTSDASQGAPTGSPQPSPGQGQPQPSQPGQSQAVKVAQEPQQEGKYGQPEQGPLGQAGAAFAKYGLGKMDPQASQALIHQKIATAYNMPVQQVQAILQGQDTGFQGPQDIPGGAYQPLSLSARLGANMASWASQHPEQIKDMHAYMTALNNGDIQGANSQVMDANTRNQWEKDRIAAQENAILDRYQLIYRPAAQFSASLDKLDKMLEQVAKERPDLASDPDQLNALAFQRLPITTQMRIHGGMSGRGSPGIMGDAGNPLFDSINRAKAAKPGSPGQKPPIPGQASNADLTIAKGVAEMIKNAPEGPDKEQRTQEFIQRYGPKIGKDVAQQLLGIKSSTPKTVGPKQAGPSTSNFRNPYNPGQSTEGEIPRSPLKIMGTPESSNFNNPYQQQ